MGKEKASLILARNGSQSSMNCVILSAGEIADYGFMKQFIHEGDYIIAADGGYRHLKPLGVACDYFIGDFDSFDGQPDCEWEKYPAEKDDTDTMLAIKHGLLRGLDSFVILGGLGGRLDHTVGNFSALEYLKAHGACGMLLDERSVVRLAGPGDSRRTENGQRFGEGLRPMLPDGYLSLFPFGCDSAVVSVSGVKYPLDRQRLHSDFPLGVSNRVTDEAAFDLRVHEGKILVVECKKD